MAIFLLLRIASERALSPPLQLPVAGDAPANAGGEVSRGQLAPLRPGSPSIPVQQHRREKGSEFSADENRWTEYRSPSTRLE